MAGRDRLVYRRYVFDCRINPFTENGTVRPGDFRRWRKSLKLSQKEAAHALGLKRRVVQYYEKGERDGEPVEIPKSVRLACYAISVGVPDYNGPRD